MLFAIRQRAESLEETIPDRKYDLTEAICKGVKKIGLARPGQEKKAFRNMQKLGELPQKSTSGVMAMQVFDVQSKEDKIIITIDRSSVAINFLESFLDRLRVEQIVQKAEFSEDILVEAENIKHEWWRKNKDSFLEKI